MPRTLAELARSDAPLPERLGAARALATAAAALAARGKAHGALSPAAVALLDGGEVALLPAGADAPLARAGYDAPEVARGGRRSVRGDAFSVGALAWLALAGRGPFDAEEPLEAVRRALHVEADPVRLHAPGVPGEVEAAIAALLEKAPSRRGSAAALVAAIDRAGREERSGAVAALGPPLPGPLPRSAGERGATGASPLAWSAPERGVAGATPVAWSAGQSEALGASAHPGGAARGPGLLARAVARLPTASEALSGLGRAASAAAHALFPAAARAFRAARGLPPLPRTALAALPAFALALVFLPRSDAALARRVADLLARGEAPAARTLVEDAARRRPASPVVEKLRGDVACARGAPGECLRRYRIAVAARAELSEDPALRLNARRLLDRGQSCGTRRAAAQLLGELRDPDALPALEEARRSGGIFSAFCAGDAIDRAIAATRAAR